MKLSASIFGFLLLVSSCTGEKPNPVPRAKAFPRIFSYDTIYTASQGTPLIMDVNVQANSSVFNRADGAVWYNVSYPEYGAVINYTFTPVDTTNLIDNLYSRQDRIRQNLGNTQPDFTSFDTPDGYTVQVLYAPSVLPTPVQFLAVDPDRPEWLVSGAAFFPALPADATLDSLKPMSAVLQRDIMRSLQTMRLR